MGFKRFAPVSIATSVAVLALGHVYPLTDVQAADPVPFVQSPEGRQPGGPPIIITPTDEPDPQCSVMKFDLVQDNMNEGYSLKVKKFEDVLQGNGNIPEEFKCVEQMIDEVVACGKEWQASLDLNLDRNAHYIDDTYADCLSSKIWGVLKVGDNAHIGNEAVVLSKAEMQNLVTEKTAYCSHMSLHHVPQLKVNCVKGHVYLDKNCNRMQIDVDGRLTDPALQVCGNPSIHFDKSSPLSLVWKDGAESELEVAFVKFPLDPSQPDGWYTWKASASLPLVVYDPEHRGEITRADQLFGNWTFGGVKVAALGGLSVAAAKPWRDGYEALATLDSDGDGKVSGDELNPLGLWFDGNRNGVSEPGEVKPMRETEVKALFYKPDSFNDATKTVHASQGFERIVDGRTVVAASIDWYGGHGASPSSMLTSYTKQLGVPQAGGQELPTSDADRGSETHGKGGEAATPSPWMGVWDWRIASEANKIVPDGYLILNAPRSGSLRGFSVTPTVMKPTKGNLASLISARGFTGQVEESAGSPTLSFTLAEGYSKITTKVTMNKERNQLQGVTVAELSTLSGDERVEYSWVARRRE